MKYQFFIALVLLITLSVPTLAGESFVAVNSTKLGSQVDNVVWCGNNRIQNEDDETIILEDVKSRLTNVVYLTNTQGEVYATVNHGEKWANVTKTLYDQFENEIGNKKINIHTISVSPAEPQSIFMFGHNGLSFIARKCGQKFGIIKHDSEFQTFKLNRLNVDLILALKPAKCDNKFDEECEEDENTLHVTKDQGKSWEKILDNVYSASWDKLIHYALVPDERIIAHQRIYYQGSNNDQKLLSISDDFFQTKKQVDNRVLHFYQSDEYLFMLGESDKANSYALKVAPAFSQDYKPQDIDLPFKKIQDHSFTILNSIVGSLYIAINHEGHNSLLTNVYHSDYSGRKFTLIAQNVVRNQDGNVDFEKINSNEGTFIANSYDSEELVRLKDRKMDRRSSSNGNKKNLGNEYTSLASIRRTKISFNRGSTWHNLAAPKKNFQGEDIDCTDKCSLHLKGRTDQNGNPIYTSESAAGLIIATGNTGVFLEEKEENLNTYLSNDGGHTWLEVKEKPHIYEIGDRGGIIVMARSDKATQHVHYSWDHGKTWEKLQFADSPMNVVNIVTEQSNMSQRFLVFGKRKGHKTNNMRGYVVSLDFTKLHQRVCTGHWDPLDEESDYEFFTPRNFDNQKCVFGSRVKYTRRKSDAACFNPQEFDTINDISPCDCTEEDFECAFGFYRDDDNKCVPMSKKFGREKQELEKKAPSPCNGFYTIPSGYQRIQNNYCQGGIDMGPKRVECPEEEAENDPLKYVPLDQENHVDLDKQIEQKKQQKADRIENLEKKKKQRREENGDFSEDDEGSSYWVWILLIGVGVAGYVYREIVIEQLMNIISIVNALIKKDDNGNNNKYAAAGRYDSSFENQGLVSHFDDEEDQL